MNAEAEFDMSPGEGDERETWRCDGCSRDYSYFWEVPQLEIDEPVGPMYPGKTHKERYCALCCESGRHNDSLRGESQHQKPAEALK